MNTFQKKTAGGCGRSGEAAISSCEDGGEIVIVNTSGAGQKESADNIPDHVTQKAVTGKRKRIMVRPVRVRKAFGVKQCSHRTSASASAQITGACCFKA